MTDPYKVLGISPQASDEEVKTAYRKLSQQYHPDHHADSVMEEIANQKMAEINAAYDQIMNMRRSGTTYQNSNSSYTDIRSMIENGNYTAADNILEQNRNDAQTHFLHFSDFICSFYNRRIFIDKEEEICKSLRHLQKLPEKRNFQLCYILASL